MEQVMEDTAAPAARAGKTQAAEGLPLELAILELMGKGDMAVIGPTDVERMLGVSKGTASVKLRNLAAAGYLAELGRGRYQAGGKFFALAMGYLGLVLRNLDQMHELMNLNFTQIRGAMTQLMDVLPRPEVRT
jgi:hypothetical protein